MPNSRKPESSFATDAVDPLAGSAAGDEGLEMEGSDEGHEGAEEMEEKLDPSAVMLGEEERPLGGGVADRLRKAMLTGLGAVFMTEEGIRTLVRDLKLPKDAIGYVLSQAERSKAELFRVIGEELRRFFESAALRKELTKLLSDVTIEIRADVRLRPDGRQPEVKVHTVKAKRARKR
jgi:hypothetical protein